MPTTKFPGRPDFEMNAVPQVKTFTVTLAELNAGKVLLPALSHIQYKVHSFRWEQTVAALAALTDARIGSTETSPVLIATLAQAQLTLGAVLTDGKETGVTIGAGLGEPLTKGYGVQAYKTGSTATGSGAIARITLEYTIASA